MAWKQADLVLIPKNSGNTSGGIKARPICLLSELGKSLERIIAHRINNWLEANPQYSLSDNQFGFRGGRSTVDALLRVQSYTRAMVEDGGYAVAVSLDISNAFNSVPWGVILRALKEKCIPVYLRRIVADYLSARSVTYKDCSGRYVERRVFAGVPQGSVLGPLLWNIAFDSVLRLRARENCYTVCYADDTLLIFGSADLYDAVFKADIHTARVIGHIRSLGLSVAENKTEAVLFCKKRPKTLPTIRVGMADIELKEDMKYLGVMIDQRWNFRSHHDYVNRKVTKATRALSRLMPNLRGPGQRKRQLYATVLTSIVMYAAPVWGRILPMATDRVSRLLRKSQRSVAIRVISAYRTVSFDASTLLARMPPWTLEASLRCRVYDRIDDLKRRKDYSPVTEREVKREEASLLLEQWDVFLSRTNARGIGTIEAVRPRLKSWMNREYGELNYYMSQLITGHGSFGHYLWRIGRRDNSNCYHCTNNADTVEHTLAECSAWQSQRSQLTRKLDMGEEERLSLSKVVEKILENQEYWRSVSQFATLVLSEKEKEERRREWSSPPNSGSSYD